LNLSLNCLSACLALSLTLYPAAAIDLHFLCYLSSKASSQQTLGDTWGDRSLSSRCPCLVEVVPNDQSRGGYFKYTGRNETDLILQS
jgi:hypothetical protein